MSERISGALLILLQLILLIEYSNQVGFALVIAGLAWGSLYILRVCQRCCDGRSCHSWRWPRWRTVGLNPPDIRADWMLPGQVTVAVCQALIAVQLVEVFATAKKDSAAAEILCLGAGRFFGRFLSV